MNAKDFSCNILTLKKLLDKKTIVKENIEFDYIFFYQENKDKLKYGMIKSKSKNLTWFD